MHVNLKVNLQTQNLWPYLFSLPPTTSSFIKSNTKEKQFWNQSETETAQLQLHYDVMTQLMWLITFLNYATHNSSWSHFWWSTEYPKSQVSVYHVPFALPKIIYLVSLQDIYSLSIESSKLTKNKNPLGSRIKLCVDLEQPSLIIGLGKATDNIMNCQKNRVLQESTRPVHHFTLMTTHWILLRSMLSHLIKKS